MTASSFHSQIWIPHSVPLAHRDHLSNVVGVVLRYVSNQWSKPRQGRVIRFFYHLLPFIHHVVELPERGVPLFGLELERVAVVVALRTRRMLAHERRTLGGVTEVPVLSSVVLAICLRVASLCWVSNLNVVRLSLPSGPGGCVPLKDARLVEFQKVFC